jgi:hypothetical protein
MIDPDHWTDPGLLARNLSRDARLTGTNLWGLVDDEGRMELRPELIAGSIYPGDPSVTADVIEGHLLELDEAGFLTMYEAMGRWWIQLHRMLKTARPSPSEAPPPPLRNPPETYGDFMAVGGARAWARERVESENREGAEAWTRWAEEQERSRPPERPMLLDAPPIGCPDHPHGRFADCGPCGTARRRHDRWVAARRYEDQLLKHASGPDGSAESDREEQ